MRFAVEGTRAVRARRHAIAQPSRRWRRAGAMIRCARTGLAALHDERLDLARARLLLEFLFQFLVRCPSALASAFCVVFHST